MGQQYNCYSHICRSVTFSNRPTAYWKIYFENRRIDNIVNILQNTNNNILTFDIIEHKIRKIVNEITPKIGYISISSIIIEKDIKITVKTYLCDVCYNKLNFDIDVQEEWGIETHYSEHGFRHK